MKFMNSQLTTSLVWFTCLLPISGGSLRGLQQNDPEPPAADDMDVYKARMREASMLKPDAPMPIVVVSPTDGYIVTTASQQALELDSFIEPYSVYSSNFTAMVDGSEVPPSENLWAGTTPDGTYVLVVKNEEGTPSHIHISEPGGAETMLLAIQATETRDDPSMMVMVSPDDYDSKALNSAFRYGEDTSEVEEDRAPGSRALNSEGACDSFSVIDIAIEYDSSFCAAFGGSASRAQSRIESIVALASRRFEVRGLCVTVKISAMMGSCDQSRDIWRNVVGQDNLLDVFQEHWNDDSSRGRLRRDVAHFFSGTDFNSNGVVGRAKVGAVCNREQAYGINWITFRDDLTLQANLFAHELGHSAGARHFGDGDTGHIMNPKLNAGRNGFSSQSRNSMNEYLGRRSCLSASRGNRDSSFVFENSLGRDLCMDLQNAKTNNGNPVQLYRCNGTPAQKWYVDSLGRIQSGVNTNKCVEAGGDGSLYAKLFVWDCHTGSHQRWTLQTDGRIRNRSFPKYIGVANGCGGVASGRRLELHDQINGGCSNQQRWVF